MSDPNNELKDLALELLRKERDELKAEVERLSEVKKRKLNRMTFEWYEDKIESITTEREKWKAKCEIDIRIEQCVMTDRKDLPIMEYITKPENQSDPIEFKTIQKINLIGYRILPLEDFKKIEAKNAEYYKQLKIRVAELTKVSGELAASESEIKSVVTEINSIKAERNAVIKAHADLLAECQWLKTKLKFLETRLSDDT